MKPGEHPEFFRWPAPEGRSRESTIRLDREGRFWHDGVRVEHPGMQRAFASWIDRHPDDGRFILQNGYDWTYFSVDDVPFFVRAIRVTDAGVSVLLSDDSEEALDPASLAVGENDAVYLRVKGGRFEARLTPEAQTQLAPLLIETQAGEPALLWGGATYPIRPRE
ncbi:MAG: DUF1285 domain-containing protein [Polyangiaceae bacterium]|nr:DUF1285 domain-containing protein [Polyangiaceae bacterium]MCK6535345.1 DUF1285 domain-containing protein [Polyangiaceae bacterium]